MKIFLEIHLKVLFRFFFFVMFYLCDCSFSFVCLFVCCQKEANDESIMKGRQ